MDTALPQPWLIIGHVSSRIGLGTSARNFIRVLIKKGFQVLAFDVAPGGADETFRSLCVAESDLPRRAITISILGLDDAVDLVLRRHHLLRGQALNVGFFWWELTHIPDAWVAALKVFDVHLAGSMFLREILSQYIDPSLVVHAPHPLQLCHGPEVGRRRFGIPAEATVFLTTMDAAAEPARKNPVAAIDAFLQGAAGRSDARLVVRVNTSITQKPSPVLSEVYARARLDSRIMMIEGSLPYREVMQLMSSCDVLISMHRAEGLGLPLLESMALGRPVIGTAWSGNLDFMTAQNSFLVAYKLTRVRALRWSYRLPSVRRHGRWAEPSVESAAVAVRTVVDRPEERRRRGQHAAADSLQYLAEAEEARFSERLIQHAHASAGSTRFEKAHLDGKVLPSIGRLEARQMFGRVGYTVRQARQWFDRHLGWRLGSPPSDHADSRSD